jgi:hypothetical protein
MQYVTDNAVSQWVAQQSHEPNAYLPHNLPGEIFEFLAEELANYQKNPERENGLEGMVALTMGIMGAMGTTHTDHMEISNRLQSYIRIYSIERLKRIGIIAQYTPTTLQTIFDDTLSLDLQLDPVWLKDNQESSKEILNSLDHTTEF